MARQIPRSLAEPVWKAFRRHSHRFLAIGYQGALLRIQGEGDEETDITGYICEALEVWFRQHPEESFGFFVKDDPPVKDPAKTGKRRSRTDIVIGYAAGSRPEFFFESKRLHKTKALISRYTGAAGMECFLNGKYAAESHEAGMVGYVQTDSPQHWHSLLIARLSQKQAEFQMNRALEEIVFKDAFPLEVATVHARSGRSPIRLFHILLDCRRIPRKSSSPGESFAR